MMTFVQIAMLAALAGSFLVYAGARHQRVRDGQPSRRVRWTGWVLLVITLAMLLNWFSTPVAIYAWITVMMLVWSIAPLGFAWWDWRRKGFK